MAPGTSTSGTRVSMPTASTAEVMFADADAITGMASPPFGAGLSAGAIADPELAFAGPGPTTGSWPRCAAAAPSDTAASGWSRSPTASSARWPRSSGGRAAGHPRHHGPDDVQSCALQPSRLRPRVGRVPGGRVPGPHALGGGSPRGVQRQHRDLPGRGGLVGRPTHVALLFSGAFERFPRLKYVVTEAAAYWAADMMWKWDQYMGGGHTTKKMAALSRGRSEAAVGLLRGEHLHRCVDLSPKKRSAAAMSWAATS